MAIPTNIELIDYKFKTMEKALEAHQISTKSEFDALRIENKEMDKAIHSKLDKFITTCENTFATKQDHKLNQDRIDKHDAIISRIAWSIIGGFVTILSTIIWVSRYL